MSGDTPPILQVIDVRRVETLSNRPGSEVAICVVTHEGASFVLELSGTLGLIMADELVQQWKPAARPQNGVKS